jgi:hypothetical protein
MHRGHGKLFDAAPKHFNGLTFDIFLSVCYKDLFEIESGQDVQRMELEEKNHETEKKF